MTGVESRVGGREIVTKLGERGRESGGELERLAVSSPSRQDLEKSRRRQTHGSLLVPPLSFPSRFVPDTT